jgi:undecaprenyl-diphosphatase
LAVPTMIAASGLDLVKSHESFSNSEYAILVVGFITSFIVAIFAIKFLLKFVQNHTFIPFGVYRIIGAILFWLIIIR